MSLPSVETEAKFIIPDQATFIALQHLTQLADFELQPLGLKTVADRYLDTADKRLLQAGYVCRRRHSGDKQIITIKSLHRAQGQIHRRQEVETEVKIGQTPADQPGAWGESSAQKLVLELIGLAPLQELFTLHQTRCQFKVWRNGRATIELSLDEVSLRDPAVIDYRELEAELLKDGSENDLSQFIEVALANWPLEVENLSKFERGLAIVMPEIVTEEYPQK
jgi:inorganic triphosphatase YgiF